VPPRCEDGDGSAHGRVPRSNRLRTAGLTPQESPASPSWNSIRTVGTLLAISWLRGEKNLLSAQERWYRVAKIHQRPLPRSGEARWRTVPSGGRVGCPCREADSHTTTTGGPSGRNGASSRNPVVKGISSPPDLGPADALRPVPSPGPGDSRAVEGGHGGVEVGP